MSNFEELNITVHNQVTVYVKEIILTIPIVDDDYKIVFKTDNPRLIYLCIHRNSIKDSSGYSPFWEKELLKAIHSDKNMNPNDFCLHERMSLSFMQYDVKTWIRCSAEEQKKFKFIQDEIFADKLSSDQFQTDYRILEYLKTQDSNDEMCFSKYIKSRTLLK